MITTIKAAEAIAGPLSKPSKMPGYGYGIPASACHVGAKLAQIEGTVCHKCYALKGRYMFPKVQSCLHKRLNSLYDPKWVEAMAFMINKRQSEHFRWFDSGDIQSLQNLMNIVHVCNKTPHTHHWLPTRETKIVRNYLKNIGPFPDNLTVRVSATLINGEKPSGFLNTSTVVTNGASCPAPLQNNQCGSCRACWDKGVSNVSYKQH